MDSNFDFLAFFLEEQLIFNVMDDRSLSDGCVTHQLGELIVTSDTKVDVLRRDSLLMSAMRLDTSEFQNFGNDVLEDSSHVDSCCDGASLRESGPSHHGPQSAWWEHGSSS